MKQEKETIKMVEDTFIKRHAKKILVAGTIVTTAEKRIETLWKFIREIDIDIKRIEG